MSAQNKESVASYEHYANRMASRRYRKTRAYFWLTRKDPQPQTAQHVQIYLIKQLKQIGAIGL